MIEKTKTVKTVNKESKKKNALIQKWKKYPNVDFVFLVLALSLLVIGLAMLFSASFAKAYSEQGIVITTYPNSCNGLFWGFWLWAPRRCSLINFTNRYLWSCIQSV